MPNTKPTRVGVIGLGYVGLSSAVCFARKMQVVGLDIDESRVESLNAGLPPIGEKGLDRLLHDALSAGRLSFVHDYEHLVGSQFLFLTVGTPSLSSGGINLSQLKSATRALGDVIRESNGYPIVVVKSTVVPGTTRVVVEKILERSSAKKAGVQFGVCSNPEFLQEGSAVRDTLHPDRLVIGSDDDRSARALRQFYRRFYGQSLPKVVQTDLDTAELIKYASNSFLATKIGFINLMARICEKLPRANVGDVAYAMGLDHRIGKLFLEAGPGFGGSCFPKDLKALIAYADKISIDTSLLRSVNNVNDTQPSHLLSLAERGLGRFDGKKVAVLGLSFKTGTKDVRESRAIKLTEILIRKGARPKVYDPKAMEDVRRILGSSVTYCKSARECISGSHLSVVMNAEPEFKKLKPDDFLRLMKRPAVLDARRIYNMDDFKGRVPLFAIGQNGHAR